MNESRLVLGIDFGTDSVRALVVDVETGEEMASDVSVYKRWSEGRYCDASKNQFRQHPQDYVEGLESSVRTAISRLPKGSAERVAGIGIDTTGSTPCLINKEGRPLALLEDFHDNPNAMFMLWKDHTAIAEAEEINHTARTWGGTDFTKYSGGSYSSEWFWSKMLYAIRNDKKVREAAYSCAEHCDWMPALLTGTENPSAMKRSRCAAGHKAMWHSEWEGLPDEAFWIEVDPLFRGFRQQLYTQTRTSDKEAGRLTKAWADRLGLPSGIPVAVGALDAHMGAVGGGIKPKVLSKIIGTSTCDMMVVPKEIIGNALIEGISGQVDGSIIPGMIGLEAGQSAFGDVYAWFRDVLSWPLDALLPGMDFLNDETIKKIRNVSHDNLLKTLADEASDIAVEDTGLIALDWLNGRRNPDADYALKGAIAGLKLGTSAPMIYRALVEATAFGAKSIVERLLKYNIEIEEVVALGGIPQKSPFVMQVIADVFDMPIKVCKSEQATALGAAMFGAVVAGAFDSVAIAQEKMGGGFNRTFTPDPSNAKKYKELYEKYVLLGKTLEDQLRGL